MSTRTWTVVRRWKVKADSAMAAIDRAKPGEHDTVVAQVGKRGIAEVHIVTYGDGYGVHEIDGVYAVEEVAAQRVRDLAKDPNFPFEASYETKQVQ